MVMTRPRSWLRFLWASPCSLVGALAAGIVLMLGGQARVVSGMCEVSVGRGHSSCSWLVTRLPFVAITLGHFVLGVDESTLNRLRAHERAHVRQYEKWGVFFFVLYPLASLVSFLRGSGWYQGNAFEVEARACE